MNREQAGRAKWVPANRPMKMPGLIPTVFLATIIAILIAFCAR